MEQNTQLSHIRCADYNLDRFLSLHACGLPLNYAGFGLLSRISLHILQIVKPCGELYLVRYTSELGYDGLNGTRKIGPSYAKSVIYI